MHAGTAEVGFDQARAAFEHARDILRTHQAETETLRTARAGRPLRGKFDGWVDGVKRGWAQDRLAGELDLARAIAGRELTTRPGRYD